MSHDRELLAARRDQDRDARGRRRLDPRRRLRHLPRGPRRPARRASTICTGARPRSRSGSIDLVRELRRRRRVTGHVRAQLQATETRIGQFEDGGPPPERAAGPERRRCGSAAGAPASARSRSRGSSSTGLTDPFDTEVWFGERIGVLGPNGTGKSHFLRLLAGDTIAHTTARRASAPASSPGYFSQTHEHPELARPHACSSSSTERGRRPRGGRWRRCGATSCSGARTSRSRRCRAVSRPGSRSSCSSSPAPTLLLLDEPTDNLDLVSAEALEAALAAFEGTVIAVTHDRWFMRAFDRFLVFGSDCTVRDLLEPPALYR